MSYTLQNVVDRIEELATGVSTDASISPLVDSDVTAYTLFPHLARYVIRDRVRKGQVQDAMREVEIRLDANGRGDLPDGVLREFLPKHASMPDYTFASYLPYPDYKRYRFNAQMTYFSDRGENFYCSSDPSTTVTLRTPATPEVSSADEDLDLSQGTVEDIIAAGAAALRGEIPLGVLIDGYTPPTRRR